MFTADFSDFGTNTNKPMDTWKRALSFISFKLQLMIQEDLPGGIKFLYLSDICGLSSLPMIQKGSNRETPVNFMDENQVSPVTLASAERNGLFSGCFSYSELVEALPPKHGTNPHPCHLYFKANPPMHSL